MKKTIITMATVTVMGLGITFFTESVQAETINELHNRQSQIQSDRSTIKDSLSEAESKIADVLIDLEELNEEITRTDDALKANQDATKETEEEIGLTEEEIVELEDAIEERHDILKSRVVSYQKSGGNISYLDVIFGAKSFGDFISRISAVTKIADSDTDLMKKQEEDKQKVENKLAELNDMQVELEGMQEVIVVQKEQNEEKKQELKNKEQELKDKKEELQIKDSNLAEIEAQVRRSIASASQPATVSSSKSSNGNLTTLSKERKNTSIPVAATGSISTIINAGYPHLGTPYVWAGKGPGGFDCSGFVSWAYGQGGVSIPSSTAGLQYTGTKVSYSNIQPGDMVFFNTYKTNGHVGIYVGGGKFIGAQTKGGLGVADMTSGYWKNHFSGHVRRVVN